MTGPAIQVGLNGVGVEDCVGFGLEVPSAIAEAADADSGDC